MREKPFSVTLLPWLKQNLGKGVLAPLTSTDAAALLAAVQIADLWARSDYQNAAASAVAFGAVVGVMQPKTRYLAFHAIAHVSDWGIRWRLWDQAKLSRDDLKGVPECKFGPIPATQTTNPE